MSGEVVLTTDMQTKLKAMGWDFLPYAPEEWQWMKFDADGKRIASQCDDTWAADMTTIREAQ